MTSESYKDIFPKEYILYVMRAHFQVRAKQKMFGNELYMQKQKTNLELYKYAGCPKPEEPEIKEVEKYKIKLNMQYPNLQDLYSKIKEVCPEFTNKRTFHLYWKYSASEILPISNYITYLSMVSLIANKNNNLYLIARDWNELWLNDTAATYVALPEDQLLISMVAPKQSVFTATQEEQMQVIKAAAKTEFTRTYKPPVRDQGRSKSSVHKEIKGKSPSPKSKNKTKK